MFTKSLLYSLAVFLISCGPEKSVPNYSSFNRDSAALEFLIRSSHGLYLEDQCLIDSIVYEGSWGAKISNFQNGLEENLAMKKIPLEVFANSSEMTPCTRCAYFHAIVQTEGTVRIGTRVISQGPDLSEFTSGCTFGHNIRKEVIVWDTWEYHKAEDEWRYILSMD